MALGLTQPLTEMSTKNIFWVGLTTLQPPRADCHEIWEPQPPGTLRAWPGLHRDCFTVFTFTVPTSLLGFGHKQVSNGKRSY
jgi:hypothetical protein